MKNFESTLSVEGVPSLRSVSATGLVSRDVQELGISQACRLEALAVTGRAILGAPECLQTGRALAPEQLETLQKACELLGRPASY